MKGAILIFGGTSSSRRKKIKELIGISEVERESGRRGTGDNAVGKWANNNPDVLIIQNESNKKSIGIEKVREAIKFLTKKPYMSAQKHVIIKNAHYLTLQAQNAFLKTLEEAPEYATIILEAKSKNNLLDTVISRCRMIRASSEKSEKAKNQSFDKVKKLSSAKKMELAEKMNKKNLPTIIDLIENWIDSERETLREGATNQNQTIENLKILERARTDLTGTNINTLLALEFLLLKVS